MRTLANRLRQVGSRGSVEVGLVALVGVLVASAVVGSGLAQTVLGTPDQLTWLGKKNGEVVRVNPETGRLVDRLPVGAPGDELVVTQGDNGVLTVVNVRTGAVTYIDVSLLDVSGVRQGNPGSVEVLLVDGRIFQVDKVAGLIENIDPGTAATVGTPLRTGVQIADAAADKNGKTWVLGTDGQLLTVRYSDTTDGFVEEQRRAVAGGGTQAVLVAHDAGVTVIDPATGRIEQVGTTMEFTASAGELGTPLTAAATSPPGLVPAAYESTVVLVNADRIVKVDGDPLRCRPGKPAVYRGLVYTPCLGGGKVIVLDPAGKKVGEIPLPPGGDGDLTLNAGLLFINVAGGNAAIVVEPNGSTRMIQTTDPRVPVYDRDTQPTALPDGLGERPSPTRSQRRPNQGGQTRPSQPGPTGRGTGVTPGPGPTASQGRGSGPTSSPGPTSGPTSGPTIGPTGSSGPTASPTPSPSTTTPGPIPTTPSAADYTPTGAIAEARPDETVLVSWTPARIPPTSYRVLRTDTLEQVATAGGGATSAIASMIPLGQQLTFRVEAVTPVGSFRSDPSNSVSAYGRPGGPNVSIALAARTPNSLTLDVTVDVITDGGSVVNSYDISVTAAGRQVGSAQGVPLAQRPYRVVATCGSFSEICLGGGDVVATASLNNAAGGGPPASTAVNVSPPPAFNVNENAPAMMVSAGGKCLDRDLLLHTCNGSAGQRWTPRNLGDFLSGADGFCLEHRQRNRLGFTSPGDDECRNREDSVRWVHIPSTAVNSLRRFRGEGLNRCITVLGDPAGEGTPVNLRDTTSFCSGTDADLWFLYKQQPGVPMAAAALASNAAAGASAGNAAAGSAPGSSDGALGTSGAALLLLPVFAGMVRRWRRRAP